MQLLGLYVVDLASVRAPDCCPLEIRAQMLYVLLGGSGSCTSDRMLSVPKGVHTQLGRYTAGCCCCYKLFKKQRIPKIPVFHVGQ